MGVESGVPYVAMVISQFAQVGLLIATKEAMKTGMATFVFTFYSSAFASVILLPFSFLFYRYLSFPLLLNSFWFLWDIATFFCPLIQIKTSLTFHQFLLLLFRPWPARVCSIFYPFFFSMDNYEFMDSNPIQLYNRLKFEVRT